MNDSPSPTTVKDKAVYLEFVNKFCSPVLIIEQKYLACSLHSCFVTCRSGNRYGHLCWVWDGCVRPENTGPALEMSVSWAALDVAVNKIG